METKKAVGAVVILVAVVGVLVVFVGLPAIQTQFHYEQAYPAGETTRVMIDLDLRNTEVSVVFVDDPSLMFSVDFIQYSSGAFNHIAQFRYWEHNDYYAFFLDPNPDIGDDAVFKEVHVTLGTATNYTIYIHGANCNGSIVFDNGAIIAGQEILMSSLGGNYLFKLTEDVSFSGAGLIVNTVHTELTLDINLPTGLNGQLEVYYGVSTTFTTMTGWSQVSGGINQPSVFATASSAQPLVDIEHDSQESVGGTLRN